MLRHSACLPLVAVTAAALLTLAPPAKARLVVLDVDTPPTAPSPFDPGSGGFTVSTLGTGEVGSGGGGRERPRSGSSEARATRPELPTDTIRGERPETPPPAVSDPPAAPEVPPETTTPAPSQPEEPAETDTPVLSEPITRPQLPTDTVRAERPVTPPPATDPPPVTGDPADDVLGGGRPGDGVDYQPGWDGITRPTLPGDTVRATRPGLTPAIPEPATWAMMLLGFALVAARVNALSRQKVCV